MAKKQTPMKKMESKKPSVKVSMTIKTPKMKSDTIAPMPNKLAKARKRAEGMTTGGALLRSAGIAGTMIGLATKKKK